MNFLHEPEVLIGPLFADKTLQVCAPEDPVCSDGFDFAAHHAYAEDARFVDQGADFAASHISRGG